MKACILTHDEYVNVPYVKIYEDLFKKESISYDMMLWNRSGDAGTGSPSSDKNYIFEQITKRGFLTKICSRLRWKHFAGKILKENNYDLLIVCTTVPAVMLSRLLTRKYKRRYVFDIRDYTFEHIPPYKKIVKKLMRCAGLTTISSEGFLEWLPKTDNTPVLIHNIDNADFLETNIPDLSVKPRLVIGFVGGIRYFEINRQIIKAFANNPRYELCYTGKRHPGFDLDEYCKNLGITNVSFCPRYDNSKKPEIYKGIDIINCVYGSGSPEVCSALPNKLYDCLLFKKPMIVSEGTYLAKLVERYHLGISVCSDMDKLPQKLSQWTTAFDAAAFAGGCNELLEIIQQEQRVALLAISEFIKKSYRRG